MVSRRHAQGVECLLRKPVPEILERLGELAAGALGRFQEFIAMPVGERRHFPGHAGAQPFVEALHGETEAARSRRETRAPGHREAVGGQVTHPAGASLQCGACSRVARAAP